MCKLSIEFLICFKQWFYCSFRFAIAKVRNLTKKEQKEKESYSIQMVESQFLKYLNVFLNLNNQLDQSYSILKRSTLKFKFKILFSHIFFITCCCLKSRPNLIWNLMSQILLLMVVFICCFTFSLNHYYSFYYTKHFNFINFIFHLHK